MERAELSEALRAARSTDEPSPSRWTTGPVLISEPDPSRFMTALANAVAGKADIFLCDPKWGTTERAQLDALLQAPRSLLPAPSSSNGWLMIPTGGTSGQIRFARHDAATIAAAVQGFTRHFGLRQVNAVGVLPLHHVSGLMAWLRTVLTGGEYRPLDWKQIEGGELPDLAVKPDGWTISLVPTQLERLLRHEAAVAWLQKFRIIFVGGGPPWPELLAQAAAHRLPLSLGYGMTETAAMAVALRPEEFLAGARSSGTVLPHAMLQVGGEGVISLGGDSLFRGYYPDYRESRVFETADAGWLDERGHLHVTGRRDAVIISGGEKINPAEVEAVLRDSGEFSEVVVLGVPDAEWGHAVIAAFPSSTLPDLTRVTAVMHRLLAPPKHPKRFVPLDHWPVNAQGKVNRAEVARLVAPVLAPAKK
jgi:O-succinylbenzoic acid--CoA ligase